MSKCEACGQEKPEPKAVELQVHISRVALGDLGINRGVLELRVEHEREVVRSDDGGLGFIDGPGCLTLVLRTGGTSIEAMMGTTELLEAIRRAREYV